ncbi:outer membrane protein assembly factor BamE [Salinarimonas sp. NSM]|uniref:outer membrane protein assembly factor BamE n=1 Tax=Salinarimonas sp. NSM TaxID=3458003 RepID=UPI0040353EB0
MRSFKRHDAPQITRRGLLGLAAAGTAAAVLAGCNQTIAPISEEFQRGYILDEAALEQVTPGMNAQQVLELMGTPSTVSTVGNQSWYYISQTARRRAAFMRQEVVDQRVAAIYFTPQLRVERKALYGLEDGVIFDFVSRRTPTGGAEQSFVRQLFRGVTSWNPIAPGN